MPIPVSATENASISPPSGARRPALATRSSTCPRSVNLTAFASRLPSTWRSRCRSVSSSPGASVSASTEKSSPFSAVSGWNVAWMSSSSALSGNRSAWMSIRPASTLDRSRMSLISCSRSEPAEWMTLAYSTCLAVRFRPGFCASSRARISRLFSGVRSSCDMFARNCDLYFEASASCRARSSISCLACSISAFLVSMSRFCAASSAALSSSSALDRCSSTCWSCSSSDRAWSSEVSRCDSSSSASVRAFAMIVLKLTPRVSVSCSRKSVCTGLNEVNEASSMTPSTWSSNRIGSTARFAGRRLAEPGGDLHVALGQVRRPRSTACSWPPGRSATGPAGTGSARPCPPAARSRRSAAAGCRR